MAKIRLATLNITKDQEQWIKTEALRTGDSIAAVVRKLIQEKIDNEKNDSRRN